VLTTEVSTHDDDSFSQFAFSRHLKTNHKIITIKKNRNKNNQLQDTKHA